MLLFSFGHPRRPCTDRVLVPLRGLVREPFRGLDGRGRTDSDEQGIGTFSPPYKRGGIEEGPVTVDGVTGYGVRSRTR